MILLLIIGSLVATGIFSGFRRHRRIRRAQKRESFKEHQDILLHTLLALKQIAD